MQTVLSDKLSPEKDKLKKTFLLFYNFNFFGEHFVTKVSLLFLNQHKILNCLITNMTYFKEKKFLLSLPKFDTQKPKKIKTKEIKEKCLF